MPLLSCVTFLVPAHLGSPGQRAVKRVCVYVLCHLAVLHPVAADKLVAVRDRRCGQTLKLTAVNRNNFVLILVFKVKFSIVISLLCYARKTAC